MKFLLPADCRYTALNSPKGTKRKLGSKNGRILLKSHDENAAGGGVYTLWFSTQTESPQLQQLWSDSTEYGRATSASRQSSNSTKQWWRQFFSTDAKHGRSTRRPTARSRPSKTNASDDSLASPYREHKTNEYVHNTVRNLISPQEPLLATIKRRKLMWFFYTTCNTRACSKPHYRAL